MSEAQETGTESHWTQDERDAVSLLLGKKTEQDPIAQFFTFSHLKQPLADVSFTFARQAVFILENCPRNAERTVALRKLLESKDAAVRARLPPPFKREEGCPAHDSRCTPDFCILDPRHPQRRPWPT